MSLHWKSENNTVSDVNGTKIFSYGKNVKELLYLDAYAELCYCTLERVDCGECPELLEMPPNLPSFVIPKECHWARRISGVGSTGMCF